MRADAAPEVATGQARRVQWHARVTTGLITALADDAVTVERAMSLVRHFGDGRHDFSNQVQNPAAFKSR